jgi:MFS family permease
MRLPRSVKVLGLVSLLTDASSEMIYPLLPAFVIALGSGPVFLGLVEGLAEATAAGLKVLAGWLSDRTRRRKPLVVAGYALSSLARPLLSLATAPWHVLAVRLADRVGKGTRGAPRDALIAEVTGAPDRGRAFGFHRAMDHAGAFVGPLLASAALAMGADLRLVFALAAIPGALSVVVLVFGVREGAAARSAPAAVGEDGPTTPLFRRYLAVLALFALGNSSDAFLLLRAQETGIALTTLPLLWAFHHAVKALASTWGGALSDRWGRRRTIAAGWGVYAASYVGFAWAAAPVHAWVLFGLYGLYPALTEGPERALVADLAAQARGRAFGLYHALTGGMLLPASLLTGVVWQSRGALAALGLGAALAGLAAAALLALVPGPSAPVERSSRL